MTQINDVLKRVDDAIAHGTMMRMGVTSEQGAITAYLSTVDNKTNDGSYQVGFRFGF